MEMGAWKNSLTDEQVRDVVAYIKQGGPRLLGEFRVIDETEPE